MMKSVTYLDFSLSLIILGKDVKYPYHTYWFPLLHLKTTKQRCEEKDKVSKDF
jgi:hypothetical protein